MLFGQTCKACGRRDKFDFHVPDEVWEAVVPLRLRNRVVCLACFDGFACRKGINYASHLQALCFAGDRASFSFEVASAVGVEGQEVLSAVSPVSFIPALVAKFAAGRWAGALIVIARRPVGAIGAKVPGVAAFSSAVSRGYLRLLWWARTSMAWFFVQRSRVS